MSDTNVKTAPEVTKVGIFDIQVCVPEAFTDAEIETFANTDATAGTEHGWRIRRQGEKFQDDAPTRVRCAARPDCVHVMLQC